MFKTAAVFFGLVGLAWQTVGKHEVRAMVGQTIKAAQNDSEGRAEHGVALLADAYCRGDTATMRVIARLGIPVGPSAGGGSQ